MRLLNTRSHELKDFFDAYTPHYAILSHTWGPEEVLYHDLLSNTASGKAGWSKILGCCRKAAASGFEWVWIDTCCINKESSAELSEAINSMYRWYKKADVCFAYLVDVTKPDQFRYSRWFTRGWTLQELIAPAVVEFYDHEWNEIGTKSSLRGFISTITGIRETVLLDFDLSACNVAERLSWASNRQTTREEDMAYSLMGIFDVNMPMLYGEGRKAFLRLQQHILQQGTDHTLFAWVQSHLLSGHSRSVFASSPSDFPMSYTRAQQVPPAGATDFAFRVKDYAEITPVEDVDALTVGLSSEDLGFHTPTAVGPGLRIKMLVGQVETAGSTLAFLGLKYRSHFVCICIEWVGRCAVRRGAMWLLRVTAEQLRQFTLQDVYFDNKAEPDWEFREEFQLEWRDILGTSHEYHTIELLERFPPHFATEDRRRRTRHQRDEQISMRFRITRTVNDHQTSVVVVAGLANQRPWCVLIPHSEDDLGLEQLHFRATKEYRLSSDRCVHDLGQGYNLLVSLRRSVSDLSGLWYCIEFCVLESSLTRVWALWDP